MKAREIADGGIAALRSGKYRNVRLNFANPDMVAHTGNLDATIEACSVVDKCVKVSPALSLLLFDPRSHGIIRASCWLDSLKIYCQIQHV